jgi:hypothetical protein
MTVPQAKRTSAAKEGAEKVRLWAAMRKPGAEAHSKQGTSARLKSCPDTKQEFFRSL